MDKLVVALVGDLLIEGITSQVVAYPATSPSLTRCGSCAVYCSTSSARLAPLADHVLVLTVPGNHDEARRDRITPAGDSWAIDIVSQVQDAMQLDPKRFGHVTFVYPESGDVTVTVDIGGLVIGARLFARTPY